MKRIFVVVLAIIMMLTAIGCAGEEPAETGSKPEATPSSEAESATSPIEETEPAPTEPDVSETEAEPTPTETEPIPTETDPAETEPPKIEYSDEPLKVMSYNVYTSSPDKKRVKTVVNNIKSYDPDVIGVQEFNYSWSVVLGMVAADFNKTYEMVGERREGPDDNWNGNEYSSIFYKKDKFNLIETDTYWLSDTPYEISKLEGTEYYRIMTYAVLERKSDGARFVHVNTHLATDAASRHKQIEVLLAMSGTILEKYGDLPIYFTGDFNMTKVDAGYASMLNWMLEDTRYMIEPVNELPTCGKYIIDFCFVSKGDFTVQKFDVGYGLEGSDHNLVYTELVFN